MDFGSACCKSCHWGVAPTVLSQHICNNNIKKQGTGQHSDRRKVYVRRNLNSLLEEPGSSAAATTPVGTHFVNVT